MAYRWPVLSDYRGTRDFLYHYEVWGRSKCTRTLTGTAAACPIMDKSHLRSILLLCV